MTSSYLTFVLRYNFINQNVQSPTTGHAHASISVSGLYYEEKTVNYVFLSNKWNFVLPQLSIVALY